MERANEPPSTSNEAAARLPEELRLAPWSDPLVEELGFGPMSMYVEVCWLPILGPTATWLYRRLGSWALHNPDGLSIDTADLSHSLGLGEGLGQKSLIARAIGRLVRFDAARWSGDELQVRTALAPLTQHHVDRLGKTTRRLHEAYVAERASKGRTR